MNPISLHSPSRPGRKGFLVCLIFLSLMAEGVGIAHGCEGDLSREEGDNQFPARDLVKEEIIQPVVDAFRQAAAPKIVKSKAMLNLAKSFHGEDHPQTAYYGAQLSLEVAKIEAMAFNDLIERMTAHFANAVLEIYPQYGLVEASKKKFRDVVSRFTEGARFELLLWAEKLNSDPAIRSVTLAYEEALEEIRGYVGPFPSNRLLSLTDLENLPPSIQERYMRVSAAFFAAKAEVARQEMDKLTELLLIVGVQADQVARGTYRSGQ